MTYDTPSLGLLEEGGCGHQYGRDYDYRGLAAATDFLVVMDYDSNAYQGHGWCRCRVAGWVGGVLCCLPLRALCCCER